MIESENEKNGAAMHKWWSTEEAAELVASPPHSILLIGTPLSQPLAILYYRRLCYAFSHAYTNTHALVTDNIHRKMSGYRTLKVTNATIGNVCLSYVVYLLQK